MPRIVKAEPPLAVYVASSAVLVSVRLPKLRPEALMDTEAVPGLYLPIFCPRQQLTTVERCRRCSVRYCGRICLRC